MTIKFNKYISFIIFFIFIFLQIIEINANSMQYSFDQVSLDEGLPQVSVFFMLQDKKGFIWLSTLSGLCKYDGKNFVVYRHDSDNKNSINNFAISTMIKDKAGFLWIGTAYGGLTRFNSIDETFTHYKNIKGDNESLSDNTILSVFEDKENNIWVGTLNGLNKMKKNSRKFIHIISDSKDINSINGYRFNKITEDKEGYLWIATNLGLNKYNKKTGQSKFYKSFTSDKDLIGNNITVLFFDSFDILWIGTKTGGLFRFNKDTATFIRCPFYKQEKNVIPKITDILEINDGNLWITTYGDGIKIYNKQSKNTIEIKPDLNNPNSLSSLFLMSSFEDMNGLIWVASNDNGINIYDPMRKDFIHNSIKIDRKFQMKHSLIWGLLEENEDILWLATGGGLVKYNRKSNRYISFVLNKKISDQYSGDGIMSILKDYMGVFWIGSESSGLYTFNNKDGKFTKYNFPEKKYKRHDFLEIKTIFEDSKQNLWISIKKKGIIKLSKNRNEIDHFLYNPLNSNSIGNNQSITIKEDKNGIIWIGTFEGGLNRYDPKTKTFKKYLNIPGDKRSINSNTVIAFYICNNNIIWIGTTRGFCKFNTDSEIFTRYTGNNGYLDNPVFEIIEDDNKKIWIAGTKLSRFDPENESLIFFNNRDGVQRGEFVSNGGLKSLYNKNIIYFGGSNGYNIIDTDNIKRNVHIPPVFFTKIKINGIEIKPGKDSYLKVNIEETKEISLPYRLNNIILEFIALDFSDPGENKYLYKINGINKKWIPIGNRNEIILTNLNPGTYQISVKGSNNHGIWNNEGKTLIIIIKPPFWLTLWFKLFMAMILILFIFFFQKNRLRRLEKRLISEMTINNFLNKHSISSREKEIIKLVIAGKSNKDIERELYISLGTVKNHIYNIYKKININSRSQLISMIKNL